MLSSVVATERNISKEISASVGGLKTNISSVQCSMFIHYKSKMLNCFQFMWLRKARYVQAHKKFKSRKYISCLTKVTSKVSQQLSIPNENKLQTFRTCYAIIHAKKHSNLCKINSRKASRMFVERPHIKLTSEIGLINFSFLLGSRAEKRCRQFQYVILSAGAQNDVQMIE